MFDYLEVLSYLHDEYQPRSYLEIGVAAGDSLRLASESEICVGVDPEPIAGPQDIGDCHIEKMTSDDFFSSTRPHELFGDEPIDLVFVDGMHLFEFALRDFFNSEALAAPDSIIALHDCLPKDAESASRERTTQHWTGDVWKLPLCLIDHRPDLKLTIVDIPPSGLCLVRGIDPGNHNLSQNYESLVAEYRNLDYDYWRSREAELMERSTGNFETYYWRLRVESAKQAADLTALRSRLEDTEAQLANVTTSKSWRLMAPLRRLYTLVHRRRGT